MGGSEVTESGSRVSARQVKTACDHGEKTSVAWGAWGSGGGGELESGAMAETSGVREESMSGGHDAASTATAGAKCAMRISFFLCRKDKGAVFPLGTTVGASPW